MKTITIYCAFMDKESLHAALQHSLSFPNYYGANLDALYDCLTELEEDTHLIFQNMPPLPGFRETLEEASSDNPHFTVSFL